MRMIEDPSEADMQKEYVAVKLLVRRDNRQGSGVRKAAELNIWCAFYDPSHRAMMVATDVRSGERFSESIHLKRLTHSERMKNISPGKFCEIHADSVRQKEKEQGYKRLIGDWCIDPVDLHVINMQSLNDDVRARVRLREDDPHGIPLNIGAIEALEEQRNAAGQGEIIARLGSLVPNSGQWFI